MIVLVSIFAVLTLVALALYIFPGFYLFGYHVVNSNGTKISLEYFVDTSEFATTEPTLWNEADAVRIETNGYDVIIRTAQDDESYGSSSVVALMKSAYIGFMKGSVDNITYDSTMKSGKYIEENGKKIFYVSIKEPEKGFLSRTVTSLTLIVPEKGLENKPTEIITNTGAVWLGGDKENESKTIQTNNLTINSTSGTVNLNNFSCSSTLNISKEKGDILSSNTKDILCDTNLSISKFSGYINLPKFGNETNGANMLTIKTYNSHVVLGDVYGPLKVESSKGIFEAKNVFQYADLDIGETKTGISNLKSGLQLNGTSGSFDCDNIEGNVTATMTSGGCNFKKTLGVVEWESQNGQVTFSEPHGTLKLKTNNGNITIDCVQNEPIEININSNGGNINFSNASGEVNVNATKTNLSSNCNITGSFVSNMEKKISVFNTTSGKIDLTIPQIETLLLKWATIGGNVDANMITWTSTQKTTINQESGTEWVCAYNNEPKSYAEGFSGINIDNTNGKITLRALKVA